MRKIYSGLLTLALVVGLVAGTAFALFVDDVSISGLGFSTASAEGELLVKFQDEADELFRDNLTLPGGFNDLFPGDVETIALSFMNAGTTPEMHLHAFLSDDLTEENEAWVALRDWLEVQVQPFNDAPEESDWVTFEEWVNEEHGLEFETALESGDDADYNFHFRLNPDAPSSTEGQTLDDLLITVVGTDDGDTSEPAPEL